MIIHSQFAIIHINMQVLPSVNRFTSRDHYAGAAERETECCRSRPTWDVPAGGEDAVKLPHGLCRPGKMLCEEAAAVVAVEDAGEAPLVACITKAPQRRLA